LVSRKSKRRIKSRKRSKSRSKIKRRMDSAKGVSAVRSRGAIDVSISRLGDYCYFGCRLFLDDRPG